MRDEHSTSPQPAAFSVVYVPYDTPSLVGGLIDNMGNVVESRGSFTVTSTATGNYEIMIPGVTSSADGVLLVTVAQGTGVPPRRGVVYSFNATLGAFEVKTRQTGSQPPYVDTGFVFTFLRFDTPIQPPTEYFGTGEDLVTDLEGGVEGHAGSHFEQLLVGDDDDGVGDGLETLESPHGVLHAHLARAME